MMSGVYELNMKDGAWRSNTRGICRSIALGFLPGGGGGVGRWYFLSQEGKEHPRISMNVSLDSGNRRSCLLSSVPPQLLLP